MPPTDNFINKCEFNSLIVFKLISVGPLIQNQNVHTLHNIFSCKVSMPASDCYN